MFMIMIKADRSYGWDLPVKLQLVLPDGSKQEGELKLYEQPRDQWLMILVGEITRNSGTVEFSMNETDCYRGKSGVVVKGVRIQPKKEFSMNETDCYRRKSGVVVKGVRIQPKKKCQ
ncbi:hypothetical protein SAY86_010671 [Trapa natans]|uniref:Uncharacterized protein n=1 Tax=Trapa natans TaxID=22666 RepID=A0AAN7LF25_TRANT|nr:hypothetical protein SAY86_010671 [Trapa natans]